jgi:HAD superfamily phosphoserine phosphatase-like hydrolase
MRERVIRHRAENHTLLIVTAANAFFARPIARLLHMPHLICTELETDGQVPTGAVRGTPAFREGKVIRLQTWLNEHHNCMEGSWVYSDSHNDLPLLELAEHPVAVAPDARLRAHAARLGWEILDP